ncbi:MAG TPA: AsmA-like C-terminal region-containing protein [Myxococcota bacterium]|nr:AsmA-like C-terminal region-containing protein [Myxococcota bacterium]
MPSPRWHRLDVRARLRRPAWRTAPRRAGDGLAIRELLRLRATRLAGVGALLIAGALAASAALTLSHALSPAAFAAMVGDGLGGELHVERVSLGFDPRPRIRVEGLEIDGLGSAAAAEIELRLRPLVRGELRLRAVALEDAKLVLQRGPTGEFLPLFEPGEAGDLSSLPAFEAGGGEIRIVQGDKLTAVVRITSLSLGHFRDTGSAPLVLAGNVTGGDGRWHTHPIRVRATLVQTAARLELHDGRARARHVGANWFAGRDARARFAWRDGRIEIESLDFRAYGGRWRLTGAVELSGGMRLDVAARVEGVDFAALLSAADGRRGKTRADLGRLRMRWDPLHVPWRGGPRFELGEGRGHVLVSGGALPGTSLLGSLIGLEPAPTPIESFSSLVTLRDGRLYSEALRLVTGDYTLEAQGSVGLDRSVALEGRLDLAGDRIRASVVPTMPVTIAGTLPHPHVDTHVSRVPGGGIGVVAGVVGRTGLGVARTTLAVGEKVGDALGTAGKAVGGGIGAVGRKVLGR